MRIVMTMKWDGVTPDHYEQMRKIVNWEGNIPAGAVFHVSSFGNNAIHVTDIWESAQDFDNFVQTRLMPGAQQVGVPGAPNVEIYPAYATFVPGLQKVG